MVRFQYEGNCQIINFLNYLHSNIRFKKQKCLYRFNYTVTVGYKTVNPLTLYCRLELLVEKFGHCSTVPTDQELIKVFNECEKVLNGLKKLWVRMFPPSQLTLRLV